MVHDTFLHFALNLSVTRLLDPFSHAHPTRACQNATLDSTYTAVTQTLLAAVISALGRGCLGA